MWRSLERLRRDGVESLESARAKKLVRSQMVKSLSHNFFRGLLAGLFHLKTGDASRANRILASLEAVREADIRAWLRLTSAPTTAPWSPCSRCHRRRAPR